MIHELQIIARPQPGSLERILRTLRVRGFEVRHMSAEFDVVRERYHLGLQVIGLRALDVLERQLSKLGDVETVLLVHVGGGRPKEEVSSMSH